MVSYTKFSFSFVINYYHLLAEKTLYENWRQKSSPEIKNNVHAQILI